MKKVSHIVVEKKNLLFNINNNKKALKSIQVPITLKFLTHGEN